MARARSRYVCSECGYETVKWLGKCPSCGCFGTINEEPAAVKSRGTGLSSQVMPQRLNEITTQTEDRTLTGLKELDRVLGGGLVSGSLTLVGGYPGIGKSTQE